MIHNIKNYSQIKSGLKEQRGAVLLIAILISSIALAVGLGVYNRTYKELLFSSFWKQTQIAFSSADAGLECAMYWEVHPGAGGMNTASCFGATVPGWDPKVQTGSFTVDTGTTSGCVYVVIAYDPTLLATTTTARGYNTTCAAMTTSPRVVERGLKVSF